MQTDSAQNCDPTVTVLIISYNTRDMTMVAIGSLLAQTNAHIEVIVVDNASTDGSAQAIAGGDWPVLLIENVENIGFARANNLAARMARGRYLLLLNPDTVVLPGAVDALLEFARRRPAAKIWGGRTIFADGRLNATSCHGAMTLRSVFCRTFGLSAAFPKVPLFTPESYPDWDRDSERTVDAVTGCFLLIERAFWDMLGGFDPAFFVYGEETDLCLRARTSGARPAITPTAQIVHHEAASTRSFADKSVMLFQSRIRLVKRHFPAWSRWLAVWMIRLDPALRLWASRLLPVSRGFGQEHADRQKLWDRRSDWWHGYPDDPN